MYRTFDDMRRETLSGPPKTIVAAAAHDAHTLEAVYAAAEALSMKYILVGDRERIERLSEGLRRAPDAHSIVDGGDGPDCARKSVALIRDGAGDMLMKGILETGALLSAALDKEHGIRVSQTMSHLALLEVPGQRKLVSVTDGGMCPYPTLEQKADIVRNAVGFYAAMGFASPAAKVKTAVLAASETVSPKMPETGDGAALREMSRRGELGDCVLEGPLSFDIAVSPEAAAIKGVASEVSGDADILLVPGISVGNILCKGLIYWAGAKMAGAVLGAAVPIVLVSRGATAEEKLLSIMMCAAKEKGEHA